VKIIQGCKRNWRKRAY